MADLDPTLNFKIYIYMKGGGGGGQTANFASWGGFSPESQKFAVWAPPPPPTKMDLCVLAIGGRLRDLT